MGNRIIPKNSAAKCFLVFFAFLTSFTIALQSVASAALTPEQKALYRSGIYHYDIDGQANICSIEGNSELATNRSVYVLGDSYGDGYEAPLTTKLKAKGYTDIIYNHSISRSVSLAGQNPKTSGIEAVETDKSKIATAGVIIIELGTNPELDFKTNQETLLNNIQEINSTAKYYWVNVGNFDKTDDTRVNEIIKENAQYFKYTEIDWKSVAKESYFPADGIHPSKGTGWEDYAALIADKVESPPAQSTSGTADVASGIYMTDKSKSNPERIWQFLTSPDGLGLNSSQAAGVMGNIRQEAGAGYGPTATEAGGGGGQGIVQWTAGGRKKNYEAFKAKYLGKNPTNTSSISSTVANKIQATANQDAKMDLMDVQLNFMKHELTTSYKETISLLKTSGSDTFSSNMGVNDAVIAAALIFHGTTSKVKVPGIPYGKGYEASNDSLDKVKNTRGKLYGYEALKKYGGIDPVELAPAGSLVLGSNGCGPTASVGKVGYATVGGWDMENMTLYNQGGSDPWTRQNFSGCGTLGKCGCPVITAATIISTLTPTKIDPGELRTKYPGDQSWSNVTSKFGLKLTKLDKDFTGAAKILEQGGLISVHIKAGANFAGHIWKSGHYFVIRKVENGKFYVYTLYGDAGSKANSTAFSPSEFESGGLDEMWGYLP